MCVGGDFVRLATMVRTAIDRVAVECTDAAHQTA